MKQQVSWSTSKMFPNAASALDQTTLQIGAGEQIQLHLDSVCSGKMKQYRS
jgi:hypothetical protein